MRGLEKALSNTYRTAQSSGHGDHGVRIDLGWRREQLEVVSSEPKIKIVSHRLIKHAAHYDRPARGHDLEQWVTETLDSRDRPSYDERIALGIAPDADCQSGYREKGRQRWTWTAKRPFSLERCERCSPEVVDERDDTCLDLQSRRPSTRSRSGSSAPR
jgi:hypothetical protein